MKKFFLLLFLIFSYGSMNAVFASAGVSGRAMSASLQGASGAESIAGTAMNAADDSCAVDWYPAASIPEGIGHGKGITYGAGQFVSAIYDDEGAYTGGFLTSSDGIDWSLYGYPHYTAQDGCNPPSATCFKSVS
jgi:hypothetical protein